MSDFFFNLWQWYFNHFWASTYQRHVCRNSWCLWENVLAFHVVPLSKFWKEATHIHTLSPRHINYFIFMKLSDGSNKDCDGWMLLVYTVYNVGRFKVVDFVQVINKYCMLFEVMMEKIILFFSTAWAATLPQKTCKREKMESISRTERTRRLMEPEKHQHWMECIPLDFFILGNDVRRLMYLLSSSF